MMPAAYPATFDAVSATRRAAASLAVVMLAALLTATPNRASAGNGFYRYEDSRGVVHFTNVQWDRRYTKLRELPKLQLFPSQRDTARFRPARDAKRFDPLVARVGREEGVPPALVKAVIHAESAFNPRAVSHKGAMGLMQLMPRTAKYLGVQQPFVPEHNVEGGARYLRRLRERFGNWTMALAAYNAGPEAVSRFGGVPPYRETQTYVRRVLTYYRTYHPQFAAR
jgi:soluble lytic murein transglycosylase-like protein